MRKLLPILLLLTGCAMRAQQSFPGINITPNSGNAGKIQLRTSANVNSMFIQNRTIDGNSGVVTVSAAGTSVSNPAFTVVESGSSGYLARIYSGFGGWDFTSASLSSHSTGAWPGATSLLLINTGDVLTSGPHTFYESAGLTGDNIVLGVPAGAVTSSYRVNFPPSPPSSGQAWAFVGGTTYAWTSFLANPMTTGGDIIYGGASGTPTRLGAGTTGNCLITFGVGPSPSWGSCANDPAWTSYTPTVSSTSGSVSTSTLSAAYIQSGKTVKIRIHWTGQVSTISTGITFSTPANPLSGITQTIAASYTNGADFLGVGNGVFGGANFIGVQPTGVGGQFPATTAIQLDLGGVYESN